jgi:hypothetical protein
MTAVPASAARRRAENTRSAGAGIVVRGGLVREQRFLDMCRGSFGHGRIALGVVDEGPSQAKEAAKHIGDNLGAVDLLPSSAAGFPALPRLG